MTQTPSESKLSPPCEPKHVAIIMDGNGRWARERGLSRAEGHKAGARAVRAVVTRARERGLQYLTLYAFSVQNWQRPDEEVAHLMTLLIEFCQAEQDLMKEKGIRLRVIGERQRLPESSRLAVEQVEEATKHNSDMQLLIAVSYGSREEIVSAARQIAEDVKNGLLDPENVDEQAITQRLWTAGIPDPDLVIRTSGELRVSNFLLWQIAYAELYVEPCFWPDFNAENFDRAWTAFQQRDRRFGNVAQDNL